MTVLNGEIIFQRSRDRFKGYFYRNMVRWRFSFINGFVNNRTESWRSHDCFKCYVTVFQFDL